MDYQIALAPDLGLSAQDLVTAWNEAPECRALAEARLDDQPARDFPLESIFVQQGLVLLSGAAIAAGTLALEALKDALKDKLTEYFKEKLSPKPAIKVEAIRQPGGAYLLVVTEEM